ncbi:MAG: glycerol-3-phosphate 1-O-acyltransferase PlsY [Caulobacteraceae bacterium]|nr:glycerol-3-phosphate 1-O-acyltransferase PlsY [Caulobacter sp.]
MNPGLPILLAAAVGGYLLGSIPFGVIATRLGGAGDIRQVGSGNIGATNVLRTGRRDLALITLLGDGGKGAVAVLVARALLSDWASPWAGPAACVAGVAAFFGHLYPVWLGFRGGKGVATFFGVMLAAAWPAGLAAAAAWLLVAALMRLSSLAALTAAAISPGACLLLGGPRRLVWTSLILAVLIFWKHAANIARLRAGTEPRIGAGKAEPPPVSPA